MPPLRRVFVVSAFALIPAMFAVESLRAADSDSKANHASPCGINLSGVVDWSTEYPFVDLFRTSRSWVSNAEDKPWGQGGDLDLEVHGGVRSLEPGQFATTLILTAPGFPVGRYVCLYDGEGEIRIEGKKVVSSTSGRIEVDVQGDPGLLFHIRKTTPSNPIRNIRFLMPGCEATYESRPFNESFLKRTANFSVIRFMDWMSTNGSRQEHWSDRPRLTDSNQATKGVCVELMIELSNWLDIDPWFCLPHRADDEYVRQFATYVKEHLDADRTIYIEHSNEVWNFGFEQARYAQERGRELKLSDNAYQGTLFYHAKRSTEIFKIWEDVFGGHERLVRVLGSHSANTWATEQIIGWKDAGSHADALAIAPYFGYALGDLKTADEVAKMPLEQVFELCRDNIRKNKESVQKHVDLASKYKLDVVAYEGGQHLVGHGGAENNKALMNLFHAANRDPRMGDLYREDLESWKAADGRLFVVFSSTSQPSKRGSWGILERENQDPTTAPKYQAVLDFIHKTPKWW